MSGISVNGNFDPGSKGLVADALLPSPPSSHAIDAGPSNGATSHIPRASDGLFYIVGKVNGQSVRFLIDTGATSVALTPEDARRAGVLGDQPARGTIEVETAAGQSIVEQVELNELTVGKHAARHVPAIVMQSGLKVSLLGQNALEQLGPITFSRYAATF